MVDGTVTRNCAMVIMRNAIARVSNFTNSSNMGHITNCDLVLYDYMAQPPNEITTIILEAVSEVLETPVETLPPISDTIDIGGLEALMTDNQSHDVTITFAYAGLRVLVHSNRTVYVRPLQNGRTGPRNEIRDDNR